MSWLSGEEYGLRLDLHKRVFIDDLQDEGQDKILQQAAPEIVQLLTPLL